MGALTGCECDSHCERACEKGSGAVRGFPSCSRIYKAAVRSNFALCPILSDVSVPQLYITQQGMQ